MLQYFRVKKQPDKVVPGLARLSGEWLTEGPNVPITIGQINNLPENVKRRVYRALLPADVLVRFNINPVTWQGVDGNQRVALKAEEGRRVVSLSAGTTSRADDEFFFLQLSDTSLNGLNLDFLLLGDPSSPRFGVDHDEDGRATLLGKVGRNLAVEEQAMRAGLAPAQVRQGLVLHQGTFSGVLRCSS